MLPAWFPGSPVASRVPTVASVRIPDRRPPDGENHPNGDGGAHPAALAAAVSLPVPAPLGQHRWQADPLRRRGIRAGAAAGERRSVVVHVPRRDRAPARAVPLPDPGLPGLRAVTGCPRPRPQRPGQRAGSGGLHRCPRPARHHDGGPRRRRAGRLPDRCQATGAVPGAGDKQHLRLAARELPNGPADAESRGQQAVRRPEHPDQRGGAVHRQPLRRGTAHEQGRPSGVPWPVAVPQQPPRDAGHPGRGAAYRPGHGRGRTVSSGHLRRAARADPVRAQERPVRLAEPIPADLSPRDGRRDKRRPPFPVQRRPRCLQRRDLRLVGGEGSGGRQQILRRS